MMKSLFNSSKDSESNTDEDKNSMEMKYLNSHRESPGNSSSDLTSLENSVDDLELSTVRNSSLLNSHDSASSSFPSISSDTSEDSALEGSLSDDLQKTLKRQGLTVQELLQSAPPFAVEWKSVRDVFQCLTCAAPIDFLSRKVKSHSCISVVFKSILNVCAAGKGKE